MKHGIKYFAAAMLIALAPLATAQTKLKFAHVYETSEPYHAVALWAAGEIAKRTNNRYTIDVFPASSLGKESDLNQGLMELGATICQRAVVIPALRSSISR